MDSEQIEFDAAATETPDLREELASAFEAASGPDAAAEGVGVGPVEASAHTAEALRPPASWSAAARSEFQRAHPVVQQEILKRERDIDRGLQERAQRLQRYEPLERVLSAHRDRWAAGGLQEADAVERLASAQAYLDRDPVNGVLWLARSYGVDLGQLAQALHGAATGGEGRGAETPLAPLARKIAALENTLAEQSNSRRQAQIDAATSQIQAFAADPTRLYFPEVKGHMATLLESGEAKDLAEAYDMAVWSRPDIRRLILADQSRAEQAHRSQRARTEAARRAAGSITGSPAPGSGPAPGGAGPSLRDALQQAWNSARL